MVEWNNETMIAWSDAALNFHKQEMSAAIINALKNRNMSDSVITNVYPDSAGEAIYGVEIDGKWVQVGAFQRINENIEDFYTNVARRLVDKWIKIYEQLSLDLE